MPGKRSTPEKKHFRLLGGNELDVCLKGSLLVLKGFRGLGFYSGKIRVSPLFWDHKNWMMEQMGVKRQRCYTNVILGKLERNDKTHERLRFPRQSTNIIGTCATTVPRPFDIKFFCTTCVC